MKKNIHYIFNFFIKNNKLHTFLFFMMISFVFWLMSQLSDTYIYIYIIPISYLDNNGQPLPNFYQQDTLKVKIKTTGYTLSALNLKKIKFPYKLNVNKENDYWYPPQYQKQLEDLFGEKVQILEILPAKLLLFKGINKKEVPVKPNVKINFSNSFLNKTLPKIYPAKVFVYGPHKILSNLDTLSTLEYNFSKVRLDIDKMLKIKIPKHLIVNPVQVRFFMPVGQIIEKEEQIKVLPQNFPPDTKVLLFPSTVNVKYRFFKKDFSEIKKNKFKLIADFKDLKSKDTLITLKIMKKPDKVFDIQIIPDKIKILLENEK